LVDQEVLAVLVDRAVNEDSQLLLGIFLPIKLFVELALLESPHNVLQQA